MGNPVFWIVLRALASHWRRNPVQLAALVVGLAAATALWSGVQALNGEARASYDQAVERVAGGAPRLVARDGGRIDPADWAALRRAGWPVSPLIEAEVQVRGETLRLAGIDPLSLPPGAGPGLADPGGAGADGSSAGALAAFLLAPHRALVAPSTLERLGAAAGDTPALSGPDAATLPPLVAVDGIAPGVVVMDIAAADRLAGQDGRLTALAVDPDDARPRRPLAEVTGDRLTRIETGQPGDLDRLTRSFHMNLTAFGLLSFTVGLFIVHAAIGLAFEQRRTMFRTLRATGVSTRLLCAALMAEILAIALAAGLVGLLGGYAIAAALLPDVAATVGGVYGAEVAGGLALRPSWFLAGLAMALAGALAAAGQSLWRAVRMPVLASALPEAWAAEQRRWLIRQGLAAVAVALAAPLLPVVLDGLIAGFAMMAALIVAAALALPVAVAALLGLAERRAAPGHARWFWADSRQQLSGLSLALMALLLALAVNIGVGTMVGSFRATFTAWLEDRLAADIYLRAKDDAQAADVRAFFEADPAVGRVLPNWLAETRLQGWPVEVYGFADDPLYRERWPLIDALDAPWDQVAAGEGVLVSEQMSYRLNLAPGDRLAVPTEAGRWEGVVAGVYADYGNPKGQIRVDVAVLTQQFPEVERLRFGVRLVAPEETGRLIAALEARFAMGLDQVRDQRGIRALSLSIFERTFVVTGALNTLTLGVAGIALLTSLVTLSGLRLPQVAPVWAIGLTRRQLGLMELAKMLMLALVTALLALPLGLGIAWLLLAVINVEAFGWRLPLVLFPGDWARLVALALVTAALATALPIWRLARIAPARLIAVFAAAR
ncbi:MAG: FtsX-like permease family protein [Pseudomonadota bacterium]